MGTWGWIQHTQRPQGGEVETNLASEGGGKQRGRPPGVRVGVTALCWVNRDQAPSKGAPPLRVLPPCSPSLQLCSLTFRPGPRSPVEVSRQAS